jgi:hypothetical protein
MKQGMKESHEKGVANRSAPSFALPTARCSAKRKQTSVFRWKDESGRAWEGGLILPVGYDPRYQICSCKRTFSMKCHHKIIEVVPQIQKAQRKLTLEVELSGVFEVRAATRYRLQYDL